MLLQPAQSKVPLNSSVCNLLQAVCVALFAYLFLLQMFANAKAMADARPTVGGLEEAFPRLK